ncbi:MAG TPA: MFS transporter [Actinomycetota bacterium]|nr:MFS transporter [Actinomycetota bacterium]
MTPPAPRPPILTRALLLVFAASFGAMACFYLLLSVVPLYADSVGAGGVGAGLATGALMATTVAGELAIPRLTARFGYRVMLAAGLVLLGAPALALPAAASLPAILLVSLVRGLGFAITVVVGGALVASLVPPERRGEGLGLFGIVVGVPGVSALPLGVWLAGEVGYPAVFVAGAAAALAGLAVVPGLPGREPATEPPVGVLAGLRTPALLRPAVTFSTTATAAGVVVTFLPLAVPGASGGLAALALFVQAVSSTASRWWAGRYGDRHGPSVLLVPGVVTSAAGILALVLIDSPVAVVAGMVLFGSGFGATQNATMTVMLNRVAPSGYGTVSAIWNLAYDAGIGVGAFGFGVVATRIGYPAAFAVTAALVLTALVPLWQDRAARPVAGGRG